MDYIIKSIRLKSVEGLHHQMWNMARVAYIACKISVIGYLIVIIKIFKSTLHVRVQCIFKIHILRPMYDIQKFTLYNWVQCIYSKISTVWPNTVYSQISTFCLIPHFGHETHFILNSTFCQSPYFGHKTYFV